ncbi:archaea-specific SMC-related protein [Haloarchaeobius sp. HRN-SO-5]|uniref:archaea-specific SMC-related protein n=1 Tax=Haloarchaeobius sp. HRN-SO-5 TaxID=3446118 RepID=UPI003EB7CEC9
MTELDISITNVGGITAMECSFDDDLTVITGPNASNKTSLLQAIAFGLGHSTVPIKNDAEEARVELEIDGHSVVRTARKTRNGVDVSGESWLETSGDVELLERFACLLEFNEVRQAVYDDREFENVLKAPMNLDALERERAEKVERKQHLGSELDAMGDVDGELADRREQLATTREKVERLETELDELRERQTDATTADGGLADLREERAELARQRNEYEEQVSDLEGAIERLAERIDETAGDVESAREDANAHDVEELRAEREEIERDLDDVTDRIDVLQSVLTANREMLNSSYAGALGQDTSLLEDSVTCWACGNEAGESEFADTVAELQDLIERDKHRRREYEPRLREIESQIEAAERADRRVTELESQKRDLEQRRESREESLSTKREQLADLRDELAALDETLTERESEQQTAVSDLSDDIESRRVELHTARREVERLETAIEELESKREERSEKEARVEELSEEITALTERIENLERRLREEFNGAMDELLDVLGYERIERVWLDGNFDLVIAREEDGVTRQDSISNLSESEREMVGLVLALAGYVAYDVSEVVPVLMMDTLGAFDADRTADLLAYFADESSLLVTALLPDSAMAIGDAGLDHGVVQPAERAAQ